MKQTAVEWLVDEYFGGIENCTPDFRYYIDKAKAMEKEQIIDAHYQGSENYRRQYYNEYYEKKGDCCPKCNEKENFHINYDYSKLHKPVANILCNECGTYFNIKSE